MRAMVNNIEIVNLVGDRTLLEESEPQDGNKVRLLIAEEQEILREAYQSFFSNHPSIEAINSSGDTDGEVLVGKARALSPDVILLGIGVLQPSQVEVLEMLGENCPEVAIVLVSAAYDINSFNALRQLSRGASVGRAYLLKHTINSVGELTQVILGVAEGRVIIDPAVMDGLIASPNHPAALLKELSPRELEVLGWMAKGYRNRTVADILSLELKTVERHISSIFSKLGNCPESKDMRVHAITLYMRATGQLAAEDLGESG